MGFSNINVGCEEEQDNARYATDVLKKRKVEAGKRMRK
jgi:hypothetical protein